MSYPVSSTPTVFVDHEALQGLLDACRQPGTRALLVGFNEYAKHLINLCPANIVAVYDPNTWKHGIHFRGVEVTDMPARFDVNLVLICAYRLLYDYHAAVTKFYPGTPVYYPPRLHYKPTGEIKVFDQEKFYKQVFRSETDAPVSMMVPEKIRLLLELMRLGLTFEGDVVELGSWQGGSAWFMAKGLAFLGEERRLYMLDLFETHMMDPTATMCTDEIRRRMSVYEHVEMVVGLVDDPACLSRISGPICFAHVDLGWQPDAMAFLWDRMSTGAPILLDNYGHLPAPPWAFDDFFASKGTRVVRFPWSEQGLVFKR